VLKDAIQEFKQREHLNKRLLQEAKNKSQQIRDLKR
jgi:hypothetical protein